MRSPSLTLAVALAVALPASAVAQRPKAPVVAVSSTAASTAVYLRAQRLVAQGLGDAGRVIVDSALAAAAEGSAAYAEGLFWRASLAATAADAERDYRVLAVEYSMSPRAPDALLRLAQLELARGDRPEALRHLERLVLEHPTSPVRPRASYWMARVYFDGSDAPRACAALDAARANASGADVELRNQIDYYSPRCQGVARQFAGGLPSTAPPLEQAAPLPGASALSATSAATPSTTPAATPTSGAGVSPFSGAATSDASTPARAPGATTVAVSTPATSTPATSTAVASTTTAATPPTVTPPTVTPPTVTAPPATTIPTPPMSATVPKREATPASAVAVAAPGLATAGPARRTVYAVQLAAYDAVAPAEALVRRLRARGIDARVSGSVAPFRVRVGRYATSAEAEREAGSLKRRGQSAWVVTEQPQQPSTP